MSLFFHSIVLSISFQVRLMLPEGLELSKLYYFWLSRTMDRYLGEEATVEEHNLFKDNIFGISLSATGLTEVGWPLWSRPSTACMVAFL